MAMVIMIMVSGKMDMEFNEKPLSGDDLRVVDAAMNECCSAIEASTGAYVRSQLSIDGKVIEGPDIERLANEMG